MNLPSAKLITTLACCTMIIWSADALAQARGAPVTRGQAPVQESERTDQVLDDAERARKVGEMDAWLRLLPGEYRVTGDVRMSQLRNGAVRGDARCSQIGEGPGMQCLINATWRHLPDAPGSAASINFYDSMQPALMLFGLDPKTPAIQIMYANDRGLGTGFTSLINAEVGTDRVQALRWGPCLTEFFCFGAMTLTARPGSDVVTMHFLTPFGSIALMLRRQPPDKERP